MKKIVITTGMALAASIAVAAFQAAHAPQDHAGAATATATAGDGLSDLQAMTFACPMAALNTAARQAAKVPSQGSYQFSYFRIINDAHHSAYEVHFKSNYAGETDLRYCVEMYCQQGWDPRTTKASITLMSTQREGVTAHGDACGVHAPPLKGRAK